MKMTDQTGDVKRSRVESFGVEESGRAVQSKLVTSKVATWCCFVAALFISIHNGVRISEFASMRAGRTGRQGKWNMTKFKELPAKDIYEHWKERHSVRGLHVLDEMAGIIGYSSIIPVISFIVPVLSLKHPWKCSVLGTSCSIISCRIADNGMVDKHWRQAGDRLDVHLGYHGTYRV